MNKFVLRKMCQKQHFLKTFSLLQPFPKEDTRLILRSCGSYMAELATGKKRIKSKIIREKLSSLGEPAVHMQCYTDKQLVDKMRHEMRKLASKQ